MIRRIVLVGPSGSGKSSVSKAVGGLLAWDVLDLDDLIETRTGQSIPEIFSTRGEPAFRAVEREVLLDALAREGVVIATGGGASANEAAWAVDLLGNPETLTIHLDAPAETLVERLQLQAERDGAKAERPLLQGDAVATLANHRNTRRPFYERASVGLDVASRTVEGLAEDIAELARLGSGTPSRLDLTSTSAPSTIEVGPGIRATVGATIAEQWPKARRIWLCVDANVREARGAALVGELGLEAFDVRVVPVASGETSKSVAGIARLWDALLEGSADRSDVLVAMGGGVVGDLAGFAAATTLRGIGLVQIPTTLLAMVDSSVGGKTGINHPTGKNLIGAFYQPRRVIVDTELLETLPEREFRSGFGEIIKHGVIEGSTPGGEDGVLLGILQRNADALLGRRSPVLPWVVRRNIAIKAAVVEADEKEANLRAILNFGHTMGHGIEAAGYRLLHGEAISVGMVGALRLSQRVLDADAATVELVTALIARYGLPTTADVDASNVRALMTHDKKKSGGKQLWVLVNGDGAVEVTRDVPDEAIVESLDSVLAEQ